MKYLSKLSALAILLLSSGSAFSGDIAKSSIRPHSQEVQKLLETALLNVRTLKDEVARSSSESRTIDHTAQQATSQISRALAEKNSIGRLSVAEPSNLDQGSYRSLSRDLDRLNIANQNLKQRIGERNFIRDKGNSVRDLSMIEDTLSSAIRNAKTMNGTG